MNLFACRTGSFFRGTVLITIVFFFINATLLSLRSMRQNVQAPEVTGKREQRSAEVRENDRQSSILVPPFPDRILYRNTYWQVHRSFVNDSACSESRVASQKSGGCPLNENEDDKDEEENFSAYKEVVAYSSFYDDRSTLVSPRWIQVLAVVKMVSKPGPIYCQIWLRENSTLTKESDIVSFLRSNSKGSKSLEVSLSKVHLNESRLYGAAEKPAWLFQVESVSHVTGRNHNFGNLSYGQRQFSCPMKGLHPSLAPTFVSLAFDWGQRSSILLPVQYPEEKRTSSAKKLHVDIKNNNSSNNNDNNSDKINNGSPYEHEFVVCVTQAYGRIHPLELVEWIELHSMLGVTKINIYNGTVQPDEALDSVLRYYVETGLLSLYQIPPAVLNQSNAVEATKLSSPASLNDCMMRHVKSARWIVIVDFDEVILPTRVDTYSALVEQLREQKRKSLLPAKTATTKKSSQKEVKFFPKTVPSQNRTASSSLHDKKSSANQSTLHLNQHRLDKRSSVIVKPKMVAVQPKTRTGDDALTPHTYVFRMAYFLRNSKLNSNRNNNSTNNSPLQLFTSKYRWRTKHLEVNLSPKSFVDPRHCLSVFNHRCFITWADGARNEHLVDPDTAFVRHYRKSCSVGKDRCIKLASENILDTNADRFQKKLLERVTKVEREILKKI